VLATAGDTTHVFGLCAALGFRFAPRIRDVLDQRLVTIGRPEQDYGPFNQLLTDRVNTRLIADNWDEVLRLAASIRHGTVSAALIMRKLAAYPRQNQIARTLNEIGQLEKTIFILELLLDPQLRRRQERGLNDMEAVNSASRAIFVGQRGEFRDRAYQDQVHRASCLHLLIAAIGAWTTPYLADGITALRAEGEDIPDELIAHLSPIAWEPVNSPSNQATPGPWTLGDRCEAAQMRATKELSGGFPAFDVGSPSPPAPAPPARSRSAPSAPRATGGAAAGRRSSPTSSRRCSPGRAAPAAAPRT
jgi:Tn3 transposase DDE domain